MAATNGVMMVNNPVNLTGLLFNKTRVETPLFNGIRSTMQTSREFITGATFDTGYPDPSAPVAGITEQASITAPTPQFWERTNASNVTQIFQRSIQISYRKLANTGDLTNYKTPSSQQPPLVGNTNNVPNELSFQIANSLDSIRMDIENCIINGKFKDSKGVATVADQTRGLIEAITTNSIAAANQELSFEMIYDMAQQLVKNGTPYAMDDYLFVVSFEQYKQLQKIVADEGIKVDLTEAGANITRVITPFGVIRFLGHRFMPNGTAVMACMPVLANALQPTPGKGNFFFEPLAKTGASDHGQIYGQWGLDHGPEFVHAKITGISTTTAKFTAPKRYIENMPSAAAPASVEIVNEDSKPVPTKTIAG